MSTGAIVPAGLTEEELKTIEEISTAAYAGNTTRNPENDVRFLLYIVRRLIRG